MRSRRVVVQGGDRGLELVAAWAPVLRLDGERRLQDAHALGDLAGVPQAAVLPVERDDTTLGVKPRREAGVVRSISASSPRASGSAVAMWTRSGMPDALRLRSSFGVNVEVSGGSDATAALRTPLTISALASG